ncbi:hypothetical protein [Azohydromonas caseinilytica]|uniref:PEP-CTERM protein-sorting domain-containing protein n=1 Tax=Azohydromonas caseinilytica TaxID=2728836 RepID=A0A848F835_9BURK|nr:hypothetical protein [Azohydromonas caseinilytica]NML14699.1 hypothetical protein [Azohydromonas caseinilytica]
MDKRVALALAAALGAAPPGAWADASASVRLTDFGYRLIDLNPDDGIAPAMSVNPVSFFAELSTNASEWAQAGEPGSPRTQLSRSRDWTQAYQFFPSVGRAVATPHVEASAQLSGALAEHGFSAVLQGQARNPLADPALGGRFLVDAAPARLSGVSGFQPILLTPFTQVVWTGRIALDALTTLPKVKGGRESAYAGAGISVWSYGGSFSDSFTAAVEVPRYRPGHASASHDIELFFANESAAPAYAVLSSQMRVEGQSFQPVPEPAVAWLTLCGLGVIGACHRRQRRQAGEARHAR